MTTFFSFSTFSPEDLLAKLSGFRSFSSLTTVDFSRLMFVLSDSDGEIGIVCVGSSCLRIGSTGFSWDEFGFVNRFEFRRLFDLFSIIICLDFDFLIPIFSVLTKGSSDSDTIKLKRNNYFVLGIYKHLKGSDRMTEIHAGKVRLE